MLKFISSLFLLFFIPKNIFAAEVLGILKTESKVVVENKNIIENIKEKRGSNGFFSNKKNIGVVQNDLKVFFNAKDYLLSLPDFFKKEKILFRDSQKRIYVVENSLKRHIHTLDELKKYYRAWEIWDLADNVLCQCINKDFKDKNLIRGKDKTIYFVFDNKKKKVFNKKELELFYPKMKIYFVDDFILDIFKSV